MATDLKNVIISINGAPMIDKADGQFINITPVNSNVNVINGQTRSAVILNANTYATWTLVVLPDSPFNDYLSNIVLQQRLIPGGRFINAISYVEIGSTNVAAAAEAYVDQHAALSHSTTGDVRTWLIHVPNMRSMNVGGRLVA